MFLDRDNFTTDLKSKITQTYSRHTGWAKKTMVGNNLRKC